MSLSPYDDLIKIVSIAGSQKAACADLKISPQYISFLVSRKRPIPVKLAAKLGWKKVTTWRRINPTKDKPNDPFG